MKRKRTEKILSGRKSLNLEIKMLQGVEVMRDKEQPTESVQRVLQKNEGSTEDNEDYGLSEYEKQRLENIRRNQEMLNSLNIPETAASLFSVKKSRTPRPLKKMCNLEPVRRSPRISVRKAENLRACKRPNIQYIQTSYRILTGRKSLKRKTKVLQGVEVMRDKKQLTESVQPVPQKNEGSTEDNEDYGLSEYEKQRLENIRRNQELLNSLNIAETAASLFGVKKSRTPRPLRKKICNLEPVRRSPRISGQTADNIQDYKTPTFQYIQTSYPEPKQSGPIKAVPRNEIEEADSQSFWGSLEILGRETKIMKSVESEEVTCIERYKERVSALRMRPESVRKVVPSKITSMAVHPSCDKTIICAGDRYGNIGFWDMEAASTNNDGVFIYRPHQRNVRSMCFYPPKNNVLLSCSSDGTLRRTDFNTCVFDEVFESDNAGVNGCSYPFESRETFLLAFDDGRVAVLDTREPKDKVKSYKCHTKQIKSIHCSPVNYYHFCTSSSDASVAIWDLRKIKGIKSKLDRFESHNRSVSSAYFSPVDGKYILTTSFDDTIKVLEVTASLKFKIKKNFNHFNQSGRWLSPFKATWDPRNGRGFVIGSMSNPRRVQFYHAEQQRASPILELFDENYSTITSTNVFHSNRNILAAGNSSGKVFLWSE